MAILKIEQLSFILLQCRYDNFEGNIFSATIKKPVAKWVKLTV